MVQGLRRRLTFAARAALVAAALLPAPPAAAGDGLTELRDRLDAAGPGRWLELDGNEAGTISGTAISRVFPARIGHPAWGLTGAKSVVVAWSGAAYDPRRDVLFVFGGGHNDYGGNEVYLFDMARREWARVTRPSRLDAHHRTLDGTPVSRHSYDGMEYLPGLDRIMVFGGSVWPTGYHSDAAAWLFDMDRWTWTRRAVAPVSAYAASAWDAAAGLLYVSHVNGLMRYDPARDHWQKASKDSPWIGNGTAAFDPVRRYYVERTRDGTRYYDLSRPRRVDVARQPAPVHGDTDIEKKYYPGFEYDPARRRIFAWNGGRATWSLETGTFRWTRHANEAGPAPDQERQTTRGVYSRWRYVPRLDAFVGFNDPDGNVWLYRPPMVNAGN